MVRYHLANHVSQPRHSWPNAPAPGVGQPAPAAPRPSLRAHWYVDDDGTLSCRWEIEP